jgi:hypothetical protein
MCSGAPYQRFIEAPERGLSPSKFLIGMSLKAGSNMKLICKAIIYPCVKDALKFDQTNSAM